MALWPFRRKTVRSHSPTPRLDGAALTHSKSHASSVRRPGSRPGSRTASRTTSRNGRNTRNSTPVPRASVGKKQRPQPNKLQRRARTYSFSPSRHETLQVDYRGRPQHLRSDLGHDGDSSWARAPTLYLKRDNPSLVRRKSSKRRHDDHEREAEIKAMSAYVPKVPTDRLNRTDNKTSSVKRSRTGHTSDHMRKRASDLSLPLPDSMQSSISGDSDMTSYKVSIFDSLAPRPTLRYGMGVKRTPSRASASMQPSSPNALYTEENIISEEVLHPRKRIDDLADDLDAKALRELMDRDTKRRDRDRTRERAKAKNKIAETAERHRRDAEAARKSGSPSPPNMERGVMGRELAGLGLDPVSTVVTSSRQRVSTSPEPSSSSQTQTPMQVFHPANTGLGEEPEQEPEQEPELASSHAVTPSVEREEPLLAVAQPSRISNILRSKKSRSKSTLESERDKVTIPEDEDDQRKVSDPSLGKPSRLSLSSLLKWNSKNKRGSGPSSFSNTSREEMQVAASAQAQAEALARLQGDDIRGGSTDNLRSGSSLSGNYLAGRFGAASKRTRSRFREDLDDFPTPPDSRVQSPDDDLLPSAVDEDGIRGAQPIPIPGRGTPTTFGQRSIEKLRESGLAEGSYTGPSPDPHLSMSLASIDSEGSWLSGGPGKRRSAVLRDSILRASRQAQPSSSPVQSLDEDIGITEDDYMTRLAPTYQSQGSQVRRSEDGRPSSDEEESDLKWGAVGSRPQFVHKVNRGTVHSQQALVNIDSADEESIIEAST